MKISFDLKKDAWLRNNRGIGFEEIIKSIAEGLIHCNVTNKKHPSQMIIAVEVNRYIYAVPYEVKNEEIHLITIYPSRKLTRRFLKGVKDEK